MRNRIRSFDFPTTAAVAMVRPMGVRNAGIPAKEIIIAFIPAEGVWR